MNRILAWIIPCKNGLPFSPPRDLPDPRIKLCLLHCRQILYPLSYQRSPAQSLSDLVPTLCNLVGCSPPDYSFHGVSQARILEWVAISYSGGSSRPRDRTRVSYISLHWQAGSLPLAPHGKPRVSAQGDENVL